MQMQKLRAAYNNAFRRLLHYDMFCSASEMFVSNRINTLDVCLRRVVHNFAQRISNSHNTLIKHIVNSTACVHSELRMVWVKHVYA